MTPARFPHSDTPGSTLGCQLPRAYRRLLRPSSALDAKASTTCPSQLVTHTTNPHPPNTHPTHHPAQPEKPVKPGTSQGRPGAKETGGAHMQHATKEPHTPSRQSPPGMRKTAATPTPHHPHAVPKYQHTRTTQGRRGCRCSRPLSRSQTTTPHPHTRHASRADHRAGTQH